ncbi:MAG: hypothetical protein AABY18_08420 [Candidatus Thermoplasmatota archaeon]|mgnify:CR=1 FL=1
MDARRLTALFAVVAAVLALGVLALERPVAEAHGYAVKQTESFAFFTGLIVAATLGACLAVFLRPSLPLLRSAVIVLNVSLARRWLAVDEWPGEAPAGLVALHVVEVVALSLASGALVYGLISSLKSATPIPSPPS